jgi:hypothetical protein
LNDVQIDGQRLVGRFPAAEFAAARKRSTLDAPEQLLDVESGDRALAARESGRAVQRLGQVVNAAAGAVDCEAEITFALEPSNAEHLAETLLEIDVGELQLGLEISPCRRLGKPERPFDYAPEGLRFPDHHREIAATQIGCDRGSPKLGIRDIDAGSRQPEIDMDAVEAIECDRLAVPSPLAARQQTDGG